MSTQPATPVIGTKTRSRAPAAPAVAIAVIAGAQLMVALDVTIVNIALNGVRRACSYHRGRGRPGSGR